ncbi:MAG: hypothetical protein A2W05_11510 [Candidatus Schekmanbacteria bacterium RBG_16_38_10]|uniref:Uncharacterized protein n=1 Tax=Candidatus Schekmanbacteria bacterium RBG_16_38_10 TaxID=1817879 RepID=A0A1F7S1U8_9BACT|nr:MAG: hypothetical protein A2W05_11510 [Candidatus Schekmanbacteria bacterium RBG_16_38_10]
MAKAGEFKLEAVEVRCPHCQSDWYTSFDEDYDKEWITLLCDCLVCHQSFQINYRAFGIDKIKSRNLLKVKT